MMATERIELKSAAVDKIFPVSFERDGKYDRVLSEDNLTAWIRGFLPNASDDSKNSPKSYMITSVYDDESEYIEFIIGGYYVKLSRSCFHPIDSASAYDVYARISRTTGDVFNHLNGMLDQDNFTYVELYKVDANEDGSFVTFENFDSEIASTGASSSDSYHLHILRKEAGSTSFTIPTSSLSSYNVIDGGVV